MTAKRPGLKKRVPRPAPVVQRELHQAMRKHNLEFDDATFIALGRMAAREDRKVADMVHLIVRRHLYGNYQRDTQNEEGTLGD